MQLLASWDKALKFPFKSPVLLVIPLHLLGWQQVSLVYLLLSTSCFGKPGQADVWLSFSNHASVALQLFTFIPDIINIPQWLVFLANDHIY